MDQSLNTSPSSPCFYALSAVSSTAFQILLVVQPLLCQSRKASRIISIAYPDESILGFKLPLRRFIVVYQCKTGGASSTEMGTKAKCHYTSFIGLIQCSKTIRQLCFGNVRTRWMENVDHH